MPIGLTDTLALAHFLSSNRVGICLSIVQNSLLIRATYFHLFPQNSTPRRRLSKRNLMLLILSILNIVQVALRSSEVLLHYMLYMQTVLPGLLTMKDLLSVQDSHRS